MWKEKLVDLLKSHLGNELISAVLFGSFARAESNERSDYDVLLIAHHLPENLIERARALRHIVGDQFDRRVSLLAKTPKEFELSFPPIFLDVGVDGQILYDPAGYFQKRQIMIRDLIKQAGLVREKLESSYRWKWLKQPQSHWALDWEGFRELKG